MAPNELWFSRWFFKIYNHGTKNQRIDSNQRYFLGVKSYIIAKIKFYRGIFYHKFLFFCGKFTKFWKRLTTFLYLGFTEGSFFFWYQLFNFLDKFLNLSSFNTKSLLVCLHMKQHQRCEKKNHWFYMTIIVIRKVKRLRGENGQFWHNRASNA